MWLVQILPPDSEEDAIHLTLSNHELDGANEVKYEALSYTWGAVTAQRIVLIEGQRLPVTDNLYAALNRLRGHGLLGPLWIDAISINQSDANERGHQVSRMSSIFETATGVSIWLGEADGVTMEVLVMELSPSGPTPALSTEDHQRAKDLIKAIGSTTPSWWRRTWTMQEYILGRTHSFMFGKHRLTGRELLRLVEVLSFCKHGTKTLCWNSITFLIDLASFKEGPTSSIL